MQSKSKEAGVHALSAVRTLEFKLDAEATEQALRVFRNAREISGVSEILKRVENLSPTSVSLVLETFANAGKLEPQDFQCSKELIKKIRRARELRRCA